MAKVANSLRYPDTKGQSSRFLFLSGVVIVKVIVIVMVIVTVIVIVNFSHGVSSGRSVAYGGPLLSLLELF